MFRHPIQAAQEAFIWCVFIVCVCVFGAQLARNGNGKHNEFK